MLITVKKYVDPMAANLDKSYLESRGMKVFLKNEMAAGGDKYGGLGGQEVELQVEESKAKEALEMLEGKTE